jgi:hypothetical protein
MMVDLYNPVIQIFAIEEFYPFIASCFLMWRSASKEGKANNTDYSLLHSKAFRSCVMYESKLV